MRKRLTLLTAVVVASLIAAVAAWAGNPHFQRFNDPVLVYGGSVSGDRVARGFKGVGGLGGPRRSPRLRGRHRGRLGQGGRYYSPDRALRGGLRLRQRRRRRAKRCEQDHTRREPRASAVFPAAKNGKATGSLLTGPLPSSAQAAAAAGIHVPVRADARVRPRHLLQHGALGGRRRDHSAGHGPRLRLGTRR